MQKELDLIVIGAGPGGYVAAIRAAQEGLRTAIVESCSIGGTCLNRGCIPTKTLMHAAHLYREIQHAEIFGICAQTPSYDIEKMYFRKDLVVSKLRSGVEFLLKSNKIDIIHGHAKIVSANKVSVAMDSETIELTTQNILIATGSVPARPPIKGLDLPNIITSNELLEQPGTDYKKLTIIGGGVIGVEFATIFNSLGCEVTMIEAMDRILPTMDKDISQNLHMILKKRGIAIHTASTVEEIIQHGENLLCKFTGKGKEASVEAESILVAIGRKANIDRLFADDLYPAWDRGLVVDENFETSINGIYAIGDVISDGIQLAHVASAQGCNAIANMIGKSPAIDLEVIPACIYTDPEIASVGLTEAQAKKREISIKTGKFSMNGNGKSIIEEQDRGFIKLIFDADSEIILGAHLMCARATDLISELATAIVNKLTIHQLTSVIRPHPTFTEGVTEAAEHAAGAAIHIAPKK